MSVTRLPVQHPNHLHCPNCKRDLPVFNDAHLMLPLVSVKVLGVTFHIRCTCGYECGIEKKVSE